MRAWLAPAPMYRSCARSAAGLLPGIGNLLKAAIAFGGTMATAVA